MKKIDQHTRYIALVALLLALLWQPVSADQFTAADLERWQQEYMTVVNQGEKLFHGGLKSRNTVSCDQCHPNASNTHPETYPKFQKQLGKVAVLAEMINWCIQNPLEGETMDADDPRMVAIEAYVAWERRGVEMAPGRH
jgi:cytochrome c